MVSEIKVYEISIIKKVPFLKLFKKKEEVVYSLTYRIDEDRFWYYKTYKGKVVDDHLMKQNLSNSISTMVSIKNRFESFNNDLMNKCSIKVFSLEDTNNKMYDKIQNYSDYKENFYKTKEQQKHLSGSFLLNADL